MPIPTRSPAALLETIAAHEKICSYIDVPLQHASPSVLKRMKRGAGADIFLRSIEKMRRTIPGVTLRTSFIVGFPGETEKEFEELCQFVRDSEFDWMGTFGYSDQEGAGAFSEEKKLPEREIERRRKHLMGIQRKISKRKKKALVGEEFDLVLEGISDESDLLLEGRTPDARTGNRRQGIRQRRSRRGGTEDGRVLSLPDHRSPRLRSGRQNRLKIRSCRKPHGSQDSS